LKSTNKAKKGKAKQTFLSLSSWFLVVVVVGRKKAKKESDEVEIRGK
jgi:hypothetical protein